ncbi:hypothetical protein C469_13645 [Halorubrum lipolyticum DSM 21995]|uniref:Uncharacterized protein n=1 Tax=Halorubrum lipolyticum DSM 21995 TaxID=1227482 RepID=M0NJU5_9EURY|nr:hypothetical protein C469_13645 [Halorubrum lipolyticum DSM 21995]
MLAVNTLVGAVLVAGAYDLKDHVLGWISWIGGAVVGGFVGWVVLPEFVAVPPAAGQRLVLAGAAVLIGTVLGRVLIPLAARFAVSIAAFVFATLAVLVLTAGESLLRRFYDPGASGLDAVAVDAAIESSLLSQPAFQRFLLVAVLVGVVAGILAMRYYDYIITVSLVALGAGLVATTVPVWQAVAAGESVAFVEQAGPSNAAFAAVFVVGVAVQYVRHSGSGPGGSDALA